MDFLDPRKRRAYNIRLVVGYFLVAIVIGLATVIIVYGANGYGINTKTGQIVQNGLLFTDSNPGGAEIFINGTDKNTKTSARLILPAGNYDLTLKKAGYRDWSRKFTLSEQSVARYVYPLLLPQTPKVTIIKNYATQPGLLTQSPNQQWLLVQNNQASSVTLVFDQYDTTTLDQTAIDLKQVSIPPNVLSDYSAASKIMEIEWSTDNNNVLLHHEYPGGSEFIVFNRDKPDQSFNVNRLFSVTPSQVNLYNKRADRLYLFNQTDGNLRLATVGDTSIQPILKGVLAFKPYAKDLITYVSADGAADGMVTARIWNNGQTYRLNEFSAGAVYLIDAAQFQDDFYYAAGSDTSERINIYKNPLDDLRDPAVARALPLLSLRITGAQKLGFSKNARFISVNSLQQNAVHDFETGDTYNYQIKQPLNENVLWMDGHRLVGNSQNKVLIMDYDGTNSHLLTDSIYPKGALFSANYRHLLTTLTSPDGSAINLLNVDMRAGIDLPNQ